MNRKNRDIPNFDAPAREREWQAQEAAMQHERLRLNPGHDDPRTLGYRLLTRALKVEPPGGLPGDFAQRMGALAAESKHAPAATLESTLTISLASALVLSAIAATVGYGATWWPAFAALLPAPSIMQWLLALIGCLGLTWLVGAGSRLATNQHNLG